MYHYLFSAAVFISSILLHPIHVSICEIEYDRANKALEMTMRIFIDDLETDIRKQRNEPELDLTDPDNGLTLDQMLETYLSKNFTVTVNDKSTDYNYLGHEIEGDAVFCYMEVVKVKKLKSIEIFNSTLTELYEDQTNLVHVEVDDKIRSMRLNRSKTTDRIEYDN